MPNRYVREDAIESERVNALSWQGEVFFRRLINRVDDFGRFTASIPLLRASIFPLQLDRVSEKDVARLLAEAEACGLVATYEDDGKRFLALAKWEQGRAKASRYPSPPENIRQRLQTYVYTRGHLTTDAPDSDSDSDTDNDADTDIDTDIAAAAQRGAEVNSLKDRVGSWFKRRPTTVWSPKEIKALKIVASFQTPPEDIDALETRYRSGDPYLRRDILTLLNNWNTEIDRAKQPANQSASNHGNANDPIARRNALLGDDIAAHSADAARRSREIDRQNDLRFELTGKTPFDP